MDALLLVYNVLLLVLYSIALTFAGIYYLRTKQKLYFYTAGLFLFYIFDNLVIYMTEFISWFSTFYDSTFMSVPTFKTIIFVVTLLCMVRINTLQLKEQRSVIFDAALVLFAVILLFIPIMADSALKVWLYYLPCQIFTFSLGLYGLRILTKNPDRYDPVFFIHYKRLLIWTIVFSVLIVIEDTIVIFNFDIYTDILVKINNRSLTEDIMSIGYALYAIINLSRFLVIDTVPVPAQDAGQLTTGPEEDLALQPDISVLPAAVESGESVQDTEDYSKFYLFCREFQLTSREQDIFSLLLENKNNQEISEELMISIGTAKTHTHNIFQKLGVTKRQQLLNYYAEFIPGKE